MKICERCGEFYGLIDSNAPCFCKEYLVRVPDWGEDWSTVWNRHPDDAAEKFVEDCEAGDVEYASLSEAIVCEVKRGDGPIETYAVSSEAVLQYHSYKKESPCSTVEIS